MHSPKYPGIAGPKEFWFDPRTGKTTALGEFENKGHRMFDPPGDEAPGNDWVPMLDSP